jgi:hypothetical protein
VSPSQIIRIFVPNYSLLLPKLFASLSKIIRVSVPNYPCLLPKLFVSSSQIIRFSFPNYYYLRPKLFLSPYLIIRVSVSNYSLLRPKLFASPSQIIRSPCKITHVSVQNYSCLRPNICLPKWRIVEKKMVNRNREKVFLLKGSLKIIRDLLHFENCHLTNGMGRHLVIWLQSLDRSVDVNVALPTRCSGRSVTVTALCSVGLELGKCLELTW